MTPVPVPLRPRLASLLASEHADRARHLRAMAAEQRAKVAPGEDVWWREARMRSADELDAQADNEERAARRWQETT